MNLESLKEGLRELREKPARTSVLLALLLAMILGGVYLKEFVKKKAQQHASAAKDLAADADSSAMDETPSAPVTDPPPPSEGGSTEGRLRFEIQDLRQLRPNIGQSLSFSGKRVYCDSVSFTLLVGLESGGTTPVRVNSISVASTAVVLPSNPPVKACDVDMLSSRPYGIVNVDTYLVSSLASGVKTRFLKDIDVAVDVDPSNLLQLPWQSRAINLKQGEEPLGFSMLLQADTAEPRQIVFTARFDDNGERSVTTVPIILWR